VWKNMLLNRDNIDQYILWEPKGGTSTIWYDNWSNLGPLHQHQSEVQTCHPLGDIELFLSKEGWDYEAMSFYILEYVVHHVKESLSKVQYSSQGDKPWWTKTSTRKFIVKSVWPGYYGKFSGGNYRAPVSRRGCSKSGVELFHRRS
ncbi:hypothetical protein HAX54_021093, partial [Datura stramonium]|nr:hypothetical protein [Datura stramonium]